MSNDITSIWSEALEEHKPILQSWMAAEEKYNAYILSGGVLKLDELVKLDDIRKKTKADFDKSYANLVQIAQALRPRFS